MSPYELPLQAPPSQPVLGQQFADCHPNTGSFAVHNLQASSQEINQLQAKYPQSPSQEPTYQQAHHSQLVAQLEHSIYLQPSSMQVKNQVINFLLVL